MDTEEISAIIKRASALRMPKLGEDGKREWIEKLMDYLSETAVARAELLEAREVVELTLHTSDDRWAKLEGWHAIAGHKPTVAQIEEAKRTVDEELWTTRREAKRVLGLIDTQVKRLGGMSDDEIASRLYTLASGG